MKTKLVVLSFGVAFVHENGSQYTIEWKRMDSESKVLGWLWHLCGKGWMTRGLTREFIAAAKDHGVEVDHEV